VSDDHAKRALEMLEDVRAEQGTERGLRIAEAQVHATLALADAVNRQTDDARSAR
jgi:hypothetical protein